MLVQSISIIIILLITLKKITISRVSFSYDRAILLKALFGYLCRGINFYSNL